MVLPHLCYGWDAEELAYQFPHLTREQIQAALDYYATHKAELDAQIRWELEFAEKLRDRLLDSKLQQKLSLLATLRSPIS
ncbi:MAG: DUF433 domain-containing protein [Acidobacteriota bacterium]|nr:DUF433 domain-containing protein [Acidobacteriota bacterium]